MPDEKIRAELDLQNQQYLAAAQQVIAIAEDAQLATSLEKVAQSAQDEAQAMEMATLAASSLGRGHANLGREFPHVSYAVQDFTSLNGTQGLGRSGNVSKVQRGESESEGTAAQEAHDKIDMGKIHRDAQEKSDREPAAKRKRERVEKALDQRTEQDKEIRDGDANANVHSVNDQIANARWAAQKAKNQESRQAKDEPQADQANQSLISEILKQQERVLQMSQNGTVNQVEAQAVMAQLSARIDQLIAKQREAATKSLHMDTLNTMLGTQQDFAAELQQARQYNAQARKINSNNKTFQNTGGG
ncbi:MAG: hypothetical protein ACXVBB_18145 [Isosphaeraceae bacterium]